MSPEIEAENSAPTSVTDAPKSTPNTPKSDISWPSFPENPPSGNIFAKSLKLLTHPNTAIYAEEANDADIYTPFIYATVLALYVIVAGSIQSLVKGVSIGSVIWAVLLGSLIILLAAVVGLLIGAGLLYGLARLLGGKGGFVPQIYLFALYNIPLVALGFTFAFFGSGSSSINYAIATYSLFLTYVMIRAVHRTDPIRSVIIDLAYNVVAVLSYIYILLPALRLTLLVD